MMLLVFAGLLLFAEAKPSPKADVGESYNYKPPATSYGVPSGSIGLNVQNSVSTTPSPVVSGTSPSVSFLSRTSSPLSAGPTQSPVSYNSASIAPFGFSTTPASNFELPNRDFTSFTGNIQSLANIPLDNGAISGSLLGNSLLQGGNINLGATPNLFYSGAGQNYNFPNLGGFGGVNLQTLGLGVQPGPVGIQTNINGIADSNVVAVDSADPNVGEEDDAQIEVSKHLYFYSAPEDLHAPRQRINLPREPTKKNVKILFIKAPALVTPAPIVIPARKQNEEKTVVYVLVKKPEEAAPIEVQTPPTTPPSKPEVYFIKYKNQEEAEKAVASIQKNHQKQGQQNFNIDVRGHPAIGGGGFQGNALQGLPAQGFINAGPPLFNQGVSVSNNGAPGAGLPVFATTSRPLDITSYSGSVAPGQQFAPLGDQSSLSSGIPQLNNLNSPQQFNLLRYSNGGQASQPALVAGRNFDVPSENVPAQNPNQGSSSVIVSPSVPLSGDAGVNDDISNDSQESNPSGSSSSASVAAPHSAYGVPNQK